jgi:hypothetical protein
MKHSAKQYVRDDVHNNSAEWYSCPNPYRSCSDICRPVLIAPGQPHLSGGEELEEFAALMQQNTAK